MVSHVSLTDYCDTGPEREREREGGRNNSCVFGAHGSAPHRCRLSLLWRKGKAVIIPSNNWQAWASSRTGGLRGICSMLLGSFKSSRKSSHLTTDTSRPRIEGLHASHGSMAAANYSYDHKIGGELGERDGNMVRSRHNIIWFRHWHWHNWYEYFDQTITHKTSSL